MSEFKAQIRAVWSRDLFHKGEEIKKTNADGEASIGEKITLSRLGGLAVFFTNIEDILVSEDIPELVAGHRAIDLSFGKPPVMTTLTRLYDAALARYEYHDSFTASLVLRIHDPARRHIAGDELWFMPAMEVIRYPADEAQS